jgi:copper chaperone NosL
MNRRFILLLLATALASCKREEAAAPPPRPLNEAATAYFCSMAVTEHDGPKAQIFVRDMANPYWFAGVRDAFSFLMLPETPKAVTAIYVNDMTNADWEHPGPWIDAHNAFFVIDSRKRSGMGAEEAAPFSTKAAAEKFAADEGGRVVRFDAVPRAYILGSNTGDK